MSLLLGAKVMIENFSQTFTGGNRGRKIFALNSGLGAIISGNYGRC